MFIMVKPDAYINMGRIISEIEAAGFKFSNIKMSRLQQAEAMHLFGGQIQKAAFAKDVLQYLMSDVVLGLEVMKDHAYVDL